MRFIAPLILALALTPLSAAAQQDPAARSPFVVEQTYWIKPGKELQFIGLFEKNRIPLLRAKVKDGRIADAKFKTFGCGSAIASSSLATEMIKGMTLDQAAQIKNTQIVEELNLPPVKIHCSVLAEDAIKAAIEDYKKKQSSR